VFGSAGNELLLCHLLNAVCGFAPGHPVTGLDMKNPFNDKAHAEDKLSVVDIKAVDQSGRQFDVEMQQEAPWVFPERVLYYWAKLHPQQMLEGHYYQTLLPSTSICFVDSVLFPDQAEHHLTFRIRADQNPDLVLTDHLVIHTLELAKFKKKAEELSSPLDVWCYFLRHAHELDTDALPPALNIPPIQQAMEVLRMLSQDELERERYEAARKVRLDHDSLVEEVRRSKEAARKAEEAVKEAARKAEETAKEAEEKGELVGRIRLCQRMLKQPLTPREELAVLALPELTQMAELMEQQLPTGSP
jgi:predicted transposase/invertase (TIGR01784 family)